MKAEALIVRDARSFDIEEIIIPELGPHDIRIRTQFSGVSIGTEFALIRNKISWGPYPLCTGYQATGIVEAAGDAVTHLKPGDRVFTRGFTGKYALADGTPVSCPGAHAATIVCDAHEDSVQCPGPVPDGVAMDVASLFVMPSVAMHGLDLARPAAVDRVVVYGAGQIGTAVIALAALRGCEVTAIDIDSGSLQTAAVMGAEHLINASDPNWRTEFDRILPDGADVVFEATGVPACIDTALTLTRHTPPRQVEGQAKFVYQGNYGAQNISQSFLVPHGKNLRCFFPCDDGLLPNRLRIMQLLKIGALNWGRTITHHVTYREAPAAYTAIADGDRSMTGVVINWNAQ